MQIWVLALIEKHWAKKGLLAHNDNHCTLLVFTIFSPILLIKWWHLNIGPRWTLIMFVGFFLAWKYWISHKITLKSISDRSWKVELQKNGILYFLKLFPHFNTYRINNLIMKIQINFRCSSSFYKSIIVPEIFYIGYTVL